MFSQFIFRSQWKLRLDKRERSSSFKGKETDRAIQVSSGSKMAGQKWKEVAENINTYEGFQKTKGVSIFTSYLQTLEQK